MAEMQAMQLNGYFCWRNSDGILSPLVDENSSGRRLSGEPCWPGAKSLLRKLQ